jgi:hypothetical protein
MNPFLLDSRNRLTAWKSHRVLIQNAPEVNEKIQLTLSFWKQAPIENPVIDWDNSAVWPTAWELVHANRFCESALSLGVAYTLLLSGDDSFSDPELLLITDRVNHVQKIIVRMGQLVLNYGWLDEQPATVLRLSEIHQKWRWRDKTWVPQT